MLKKSYLNIAIIVFGSAAYAQSSAIKFNPKAIALNNKAVNLSTTYWNDQKGLTAVIGILDSALIIDPHYTIAYSNKIYFLGHLKKYEEALAVVKKEEQLKLPVNYKFYIAKGEIYYNLKDKVKAKENYQIALHLAKKSYKKIPSAVNLENYAYAKLLTSNLNAANTLIDKEIYHYKDSLSAKKEINRFRKDILPTLTTVHY
ncbi:MAG: hypothetical protein V4553_05660 [Bacteroidota bacterium]